jgi:3-methyladenine DNA glycosylase/8-oxoguanine DNA glycosylase
LREFYEICKKDKVLSRFLDRIIGTRIISAFSDFEALVGAIISQNNSYRNYRKQMFKLYKRLNFVQSNYKERILKELGIGYKVKYLVELANKFGKVELEKIKGIGKYSLNLFRIFQLRDYNSFYVDCLIEKIFREEYRIKSNLEKISKKLFSNYRGLAEAYLQRFFEVK